MKTPGFLLAAPVLLAIAAAPADAANLIRNGSFEFPATPDGSYTVYSTGQSFNHWTVVGASGNVATINSNFASCAHTFPAKRGTAFLDLTGTSNTATGVQQTISTTPGATYALTFYVGNIYDTTSGCGTTSTVEVFIDGADLGSFANKWGKSITAISWRKFSTEFVAQSGSTTISLLNGDPASDAVNGLDGVSVTLVSGP